MNINITGKLFFQYFPSLKCKTTYFCGLIMRKPLLVFSKEHSYLGIVPKSLYQHYLSYHMIVYMKFHRREYTRTLCLFQKLENTIEFEVLKIFLVDSILKVAEVFLFEMTLIMLENKERFQ